LTYEAAAPVRLHVLAPAAEGVPPATPILGLPLARRVVLAAQRAGFSEILFEDSPGLSRALEGTDARVVSTLPREAASPDVVVLASGAIPRVAWLRARRRSRNAEDSQGSGLPGVFAGSEAES